MADERRFHRRVSSVRQDGSSRSVTFASSQVANDSFSQMSSHQAVVTRSPYQWWASSWMAMVA